MMFVIGVLAGDHLPPPAVVSGGAAPSPASLQVTSGIVLGYLVLSREEWEPVGIAEPACLPKGSDRRQGLHTVSPLTNQNLKLSDVRGHFGDHAVIRAEVPMQVW